jgi:DNA-binding MarR family transcriptional regulator
MYTMKAPATSTSLISRAERDGWFALIFAHATLTARVDAVLMDRHRISFSAFEIFCRLRDSEPQPVRALGGHLVSVSPTRASRIIQEHIDAGHLKRSAHQGDGRVSLVGFTAAGRRFAAAVERTFEESVKKYFADILDAEDIAALTRIWDKIAHSAGGGRP